MGIRTVAAGAALIALLLTLAIGAISPGVAAADPVFDSTPPASTNQTSATFAFSDSSGPGATFKCALDGAAFTSCTSPQHVSNLSEGPHMFQVQGGIGAGPPPTVTYHWTVDLTPPTTQVTSQPPSLTNSGSATFTFTSPDPTATFRCSLNGAAPAACASPVVYTGLADATRQLLIQAVDPAGNVDVSAQPITWTVDTTPPDTMLANPGNLVGQRDVIFMFTSTEAGSTFQCSFDNAPFAACSAPDGVAVPGSGARVFKVRAVDGAGNVDPSPAVHRWTADLTPPKRPKVSIFAAPSAHAAATTLIPAKPIASLSPTFTSPALKLLTTPMFTLALHLQAQWASDPTATSYHVTLEYLPEDSTGIGFHGEDTLVLKEYHHTKRTALSLRTFAGTTVCVKVEAIDKVGNVSRSRTACTTIPVSFTPRDVGPPPVKDAQAWRGYYTVLGKQGFALEQDIGDDVYFTPRHAAIDAERCGACGVVEFDFAKFGSKKLHPLASVNLNGSSHGAFDLIDVPLPIARLRNDGEGLLVIRAASGRPRIAGIAITNL